MDGISGTTPPPDILHPIFRSPSPRKIFRIAEYRHELPPYTYDHSGSIYGDIFKGIRNRRSLAANGSRVPPSALPVDLVEKDTPIGGAFYDDLNASFDAHVAENPDAWQDCSLPENYVQYFKRERDGHRQMRFPCGAVLRSP